MVGATNRPQELDDAARRRLQKRLMIPLPDGEARTQMLRSGLAGVAHCLSDADVGVIVHKTDGYSGSDMAGLCREAAMEPLRDEARQNGNFDRLISGESSEVRAVAMCDFECALCQVRPSVSQKELVAFEEWNTQFGSFADPNALRKAAAT